MFVWNRMPVWIFCSLAILAGSLGFPRCAPAQGGDSFFSQGQAVYDAQNLAKSQQEALQDLLTQAVTQALGTFLNPSQMGGNYAALQSKILKQPERYVQTYQIFSENPAGGLYRVTGQVTVAMDALRKDVQQLGLTPSEAPPAEPVMPAAPEQTVSPVQPSPPPDTQAPPTPQYPAQGEALPQPPAAPEQPILWAVAENWNGVWVLPASSMDSQNLFAMNVLQESQDYLWSLTFPPAGSLDVDGYGNVSLQRLTALALSMGIQKAVTGSVALRNDGAQGSVLDAALEVFDVSSGQSKGELRKEIPTSTSYQEGAMKMAYMTVPQLDRLLRESPSAQSTPSLSGVSVAPGDEWTLLIHSEYPYANWEELEEVLRSRFNSMQIDKLEFGFNLAKVKIRGLGMDFANLLQEGFQLKDGTRMQVSGYSPENRSVELTLVRF